MERGRSEGKRIVSTEGPEVIPVVREQVKVDTRRVETGITRIKKTVHEREEIVDAPLIKETVQVERVPVNRYVREPLPVRQEGGTTIVPVMEEVLVVEKRLLLKEELRITKQSDVSRKPQRVVLRGEDVDVERLDPRGEHEAKR